MEDFQQSYYSFKESAKLGSDTGLCMCGLMLFYGLYKKRDVKKSCFYFSKCNQNPISLLHLGISCSEDIYIKIARKIKTDSHGDVINDSNGVFNDLGVKNSEMVIDIEKIIVKML